MAEIGNNQTWAKLCQSIWSKCHSVSKDNYSLLANSLLISVFAERSPHDRKTIIDKQFNEDRGANLTNT